MRFCKATGRFSHQFDPQTHRCPCGRWERGYKPKKEPARPRDECQICERKQALDLHGNLVHHGYKRPGWGYIQGDCMGVNHKPYPATDALEIYLQTIKGYLKNCQITLENLPTLTTFTFNYEQHGVKSQTIVNKGDTHHYDHEKRITLPAFEDLIAWETKRIKSEIDFATQDINRVVKRIEKGHE